MPYVETRARSLLVGSTNGHGMSTSLMMKVENLINIVINFFLINCLKNEPHLHTIHTDLGAIIDASEMRIDPKLTLNSVKRE